MSLLLHFFSNNIKPKTSCFSTYFKFDSMWSFCSAPHSLPLYLLSVSVLMLSSRYNWTLLLRCGEHMNNLYLISSQQYKHLFDYVSHLCWSPILGLFSPHLLSLNHILSFSLLCPIHSFLPEFTGLEWKWKWFISLVHYVIIVKIGPKDNMINSVGFCVCTVTFVAGQHMCKTALIHIQF